MLNKTTVSALTGWCARLMAKVTGRSIQEECRHPTYPLVNKIRARRLRWLGHILRSPEGYLVRQVVVAQCELWLQLQVPYPMGSIMMDAPPHDTVEHLVQIAEDRDQWRMLVNSIAAQEGEIEELDVSLQNDYFD